MTTETYADPAATVSPQLVDQISMAPDSRQLHAQWRQPASPRYFHLLWDEEIERLGLALEILREHACEVITRWHQLYTIHLGEARSLSEREFTVIYGDDLTRLIDNLLLKKMEEFVADLRATGERLVERGVPFREVVAVLHLFEESCSDTLHAAGLPPWTHGESTVAGAASMLMMTFDKITHCRLIVIADAYFEAARARATTRVRALEEELVRLSPDVKQRCHFHGIVGQSAAMREVFQRVEAAAASRGTVFITGESGTGKELVARAIHELGSEKGAAFVPVNCSALPRELIESELFGYKRGAFSGAVSEYMGLFRAAEGGTILLDEITEMTPETQAKLLRVLQERTIRPVGSVREIPISVRIMASTNAEPQEAVNRGLLRRDLYYRLNVNTLRLPPLRERMEDLALLVDHLLDFFSEKLGCPRRDVTPATWDALRQYSWPGNVRELMNVIESAHTFGRGTTIDKGDLPTNISKVPPVTGTCASLSTFANMEKSLIMRALEATGGNKLRAARLLGISRKKLYAKIEKYHLKGMMLK